MDWLRSLDIDDEIEMILARFPDRFTEEEKEDLRSGDCEVRQCSVCGDFMWGGFLFYGGEAYYCSEECMEKDGISWQDYLLYYMGYDPKECPGEIPEELNAMSDEELHEYSATWDGDSEVFYTEWEADPDIIDRLNKCRREMQ